MVVTTLGTSHGYNTAGNFYTSTHVGFEGGEKAFLDHLKNVPYPMEFARD